ncbi:Neuralized-like protein 1A, partial [Stegodyphus mimosarum]
MGTEYSVHKNRTVSPSDEGMALRMRNNYHPLHFHQVHGDNIKLSKDGTVACRSEGFCKGIVFSDRPVMVCEQIFVKFVDISTNWSGALRIGFTMNDPVSLKSKLPRYACPDLTSMHGNWAKAIAERQVKKDSILFYYVDQNGDVHYGIDNEEHGVFFGGVNTSSKLWAVLDIYGNTVAVEFLDPGFLNQDSVTDVQSSALTIFRNKGNQSASGLLQISNLNCNLSFHRLHGKNVVLKKNGAVVSRKPGCYSLAYAFTEKPINIGENVIMQVLQTDYFARGPLMYGITSCNPSYLDQYELPENTDDLMDRLEYWVVKPDTNHYRIGDIIVYKINAEGEVSILKNDQKSAVFHVDPTQPLWLFINIIGSISELWLVGTSCNNAVTSLENQFESMTISSEPSADMSMTSRSPNQQSFTECVICYEEPVNCALYRCGHMCMCYNCATKMWKPSSTVHCPICRETIQDVIKIYR